MAWSSSGVINAIEDFTAFDQDIYLKTLESGNECTAAIKKLTQSIDIVFQQDTFMKKELFQAFSNENMDIV